MIPKIIHFCVGHALTSAQHVVIQRARDLHPEWEIKVWQDPVDPAGFTLSDLWSSANSGAQLADLIRIEAVHAHGGIYVDSDVMLRKPLDPLATHHEFFIASEDGDTATNAVFGASKGHAALGAMIECLRAGPVDWTQSPNLMTGPALFARVLKGRRDVTVLPRETFYPYNWNERPRPPHRHSYGVHEWEGSWKRRTLRERIEPSLRALLPSRLAAGVLRRASAWRQASAFALRHLSQRERFCSGGGTLVGATVHGFRIVLDAGDTSITPAIAHRGYFDLSEELFVGRLVKGGDSVIDVGANVGLLALLAASRVHSFGRVVAYEANPAIAALLSTSAAINGMHERIVIRHAAVGASAATGILGANSVPTVALDDEFPCDLPIKLLRVDARAFDSEVVAGARRLLTARCFDSVTVGAAEEVAGAGFSRWIEAVREVCGYRYEPYVLDSAGRVSKASLTRIASGNRRTPNVVLMAR